MGTLHVHCPTCGERIDVPALGPTGRYPHGRYTAHDQGELNLRVATDETNRVVLLEFGTDVRWLALPAAQSQELGETLLKRAALLRGLPVS